MKKYFHFFSDGADAKDLITCEKDFIETMNRLAVVSYKCGVSILGFGIEDTHIHALGEAEEQDAVKFKRQFQQETRRYITISRDNRLDAVFTFDMLHVKNDDNLKIGGIYVITQATKDGKRIMPYDYKWCSASLYFRTRDIDTLWTVSENGVKKVVREMSSFSRRDRERLFRTKNVLPAWWKVCDGLILPSSFVDIRNFDGIYNSHNAFRCFLGSGRNKDRVVLDSMAEAHGVSMDEAEARHVVAEVCQELYGRCDPRRLDVQKRITLAREVRRRYGIGFIQLSRRVHLPEAEVRKYVK